MVVRRPSWWNAAHTLRVLALALLIIVLTAVALFRQVRRGIRTASELRRAQETTRCALEQMEHQAHHDPLTGLANRLMFDNSILKALDLAERTRQRVGLLYLDLDRFKAINVLAAPYRIDGMPWHCPGSMGLTLFPKDAESAATLQRNADTALYRAKRACPGQLVTFDRRMSEHAERSELLENALRRGVEKMVSRSYINRSSAPGETCTHSGRCCG